MPDYTYEAVDQSGADRKGSVKAETIERARILLKDKGLRILDLHISAKQITHICISCKTQCSPDISIQKTVNFIGAGLLLFFTWICAMAGGIGALIAIGLFVCAMIVFVKAVNGKANVKCKICQASLLPITTPAGQKLVNE